MASSPKSAVFFEHCSKGGGDQTHVQKFWSKFCMILKAFWQHKIDIKRLFKGRNVWRVTLERQKREHLKRDSTCRNVPSSNFYGDGYDE